MELKDRQVLVVGFGKTGKAVARFLLDQQAVVTINDNKVDLGTRDDVTSFENDGARFVLGDHPTDVFLHADLIVLSPGIDPMLPSIREARKKGIAVVSEIELASWFIKVPIIGITGTNGKTTTTSLITDILRCTGLSVFMGGNIGTPLVNFVQERLCADFLVIELSSFQLEEIKNFSPYIAILLNITEDHLDRYSNFAAYCEAKARIFMNQTVNDFAIVNYDDAACQALIPSLTAMVIPFSRKKVLSEGMYSNATSLYFRGRDDAVHTYNLTRIKLFGIHNQENMLAAIGAAEICGCPPEKIQEALEKFQGLHHRIEYVQEVDGVSFYNDSKATNIDALLKSLQSFSQKVILIAGGREKGGDYGVLTSEIARRVKLLVVIGEAREKFLKLFGTVTNTNTANDLEEAVQIASCHATKGDVVLLAPGCASFDMFADYEDRGKRFVEAVQKLARNKKRNLN